MREFKRQTMQQQQTVTVVHVDDSGEAHTLPADAGNQTKDSTLYGAEDGRQDQMMKPCPCLPAVSAEFPELPAEGGCLAAMKFILGWFLFVLSFPFVCAFTWTIPDCSEAHNRKYFLASFFLSILWIAILSFGMVTLVGRSGCILSVDKFTMGLVVIAIGTSVPVSFFVCFKFKQTKSSSWLNRREECTPFSLIRCSFVLLKLYIHV